MRRCRSTSIIGALRIAVRPKGCQIGYPTRVDTILLEGIEVPAALGVSKAERQMRRPVGIELELVADLRRSGRSDRLADAIDYAEIYRTVEEIAGTLEHRLVEALAERIAGALLTRYPIEAVTVTVRKFAPVGGNLRHAGVRITRSNGDPRD